MEQKLYPKDWGSLVALQQKNDVREPGAIQSCHLGCYH